MTSDRREWHVPVRENVWRTAIARVWVKRVMRIVDVTPQSVRRRRVCTSTTTTTTLNSYICPNTKGTNKISRLEQQKEEGYWVTSNNRRTFITKDGDELTGSKAYRAYSKTSKFKKGKKKRRRRRRWFCLNSRYLSILHVSTTHSTLLVCIYLYIN